MRVSIVPIRPGPAAGGLEDAWSRKVVVVLPLVPVTPATSSVSVGRPKNSSAATGIASRALVDDELRHGQLERPLDDERDGAVLDRLRREVVPVGADAGDAEEEAARAGPPRVVGEVEHVDAARCPRRPVERARP